METSPNYTGDSQVYTFETHKRKRYKARDTIQYYGGTIDEEAFCSDFCTTIQDPRLVETARRVRSPDHPHHNNFIKITEHLTSAMCGQSMKHQNISSTTTTNHNGNGGGNGNGNGSGKRQKKEGGHGRGNGSNHDDSGGDSSEGSSTKSYDGVIKPKHYPRHVYRTFTLEQKLKHKELMQQKKQNRTVSATMSTEEPIKEEPKGTGIGNQFGSAAHS